VIDRASVERAAERFTVPEGAMDRLIWRRDRKRRNQRIAAGVVGIAVFVAAVWIVTSGAWLDRSETSVPAVSGTTGPVETGPAETGPPAVSVPFVPFPRPRISAIAPHRRAVPATDYLFDLDTGQMTPLPESIVGDDWAHDYAASPDGSRLAYVGPANDGSSQVFIANLDGTGVTQVTRDAEAREPAWSPDASKIAYIGQRGHEPANIFVLDLATGVSTQVTFEPQKVFQNQWGRSFSFTPDGASIVYNATIMRADSVGGEIRIVPIAGGESTLLANLPDYEGDLQLSPDGSQMAYSCGTGGGYSGGDCVADADGTHGRQVSWGNGDVLVSAVWSPDGTRLVLWQFHQMKVYVLNVDMGAMEQVTFGTSPVWLDDDTLIVKADCTLGPRSNVCAG
jgi:Tol biopolymer transport system component